jgi:hypothetical protein
MIEVGKVHPLFDQILAQHFMGQQPHEDIDRTVKPQRRATRNEDYYEYHESKEDLGERYNGGYGR